MRAAAAVRPLLALFGSCTSSSPPALIPDPHFLPIPPTCLRRRHPRRPPVAAAVEPRGHVGGARRTGRLSAVARAPHRPDVPKGSVSLLPQSAVAALLCRVSAAPPVPLSVPPCRAAALQSSPPRAPLCRLPLLCRCTPRPPLFSQPLHPRPPPLPLAPLYCRRRPAAAPLSPPLPPRSLLPLSID